MDHDLIDHYVSEYMHEKKTLANILFKDDSPLFNEKYLAHFIKVGKQIFDHNLTSSGGGNLSITDGDTIWITRTGAHLGDIAPEDVIVANWNPNEDDERVSSEMNVHHAIYSGGKAFAKQNGEELGNMAVVHVHSPYTIFRSMVSDRIPSVDSESKRLLGKATKVVETLDSLKTEEAYRTFESLAAGGTKIMAVRGHGVFATGETLDDAFDLITTLEHNCMILNMFECTGRKFAE